MLNKVLKVLCKIFVYVLLLGIIVYFAIAYYYRNKFMINTWINGIYCTAKTVDEVNSELLYDTKAPILTIKGKNNSTSKLDLSLTDYYEDYTGKLQAYIANSNAFLWPVNLFKGQNEQIEPDCGWDEEKVKQLLYELDAVKEYIGTEPDVKIVPGKNGYELIDNMKNVFDPDTFFLIITDNLHKGIYFTDIEESGCFYDLEDNEAQKRTRLIWEKICALSDCEIVYDMGSEKLALDKKLLSSFIKTTKEGEILLDDTGELLPDEESMTAFIKELAEEYDTVGKTLHFQSTRGDVIDVPYVTYGTKLDQKAELAFLKETFLRKKSQVHIPAYIQEGFVRGKDDIGNTYIEIDMTKQKLYCYKDGEIIVETDIVTGNLAKKYDTPAGVNYVYIKQKDRILRGRDYASHVDYWMPVKGNIGIHDANWRRKFGGEIYKKSGSHGCINVPPKIMPTIYEEMDLGTPVIMFY